jgi:hypothetical protein
MRAWAGILAVWLIRSHSGTGSFSIRSTGVDGQQVTDTFTWPAGGIAGALLTEKGNFQ